MVQREEFPPDELPLLLFLVVVSMTIEFSWSSDGCLMCEGVGVLVMMCDVGRGESVHMLCVFVRCEVGSV